MVNLRLHTGGTPAVLHLYVAGAAVEVRIERDRESRPFWLGRFSKRRVPGAVPAGPDRWYVPAVSIAEMEEAAALRHGQRHARRMVHERIRDDLRRLRGYGRTWTLYRLTVAVSRDGLVLGSETVSGLGEHALPFMGGAELIERIASELLAPSR